MGFFDKLVDAWTDWNTDWSRVGENFKAAGKAAMNSTLSARAGTINLLMAPFSDVVSTRAALDEYGKSFNEAKSALGGAAGGLGDIPVLRQVFGTLDWLQTETVKRPVATSALVFGDAWADRGSLFDGGAWRSAYNTTTYVTPGQAWTYQVTAASQKIYEWARGEELSEVERRDILRHSPHLGFIAKDPAEVDPRDREQRKQYYDNPYMKTMSGTMDAAITIFGDPSIVAGKAGTAAKARYWSKEMNAAAISNGRHFTFMGTGAYAKAKEFIQNAESPDRVTQTMFNNKYNGDLASNLLWSVARDQEQYALRGGQYDLYDLTWLSLYGDQGAWRILADEAPRVADVVGSKFANYTIGNLAKQFGMGDRAVDEQWNALRETKGEAFADAMVNGHGAWGRLGEGVEAGGLLTGQAVPRLRASSKWRVGVHQWVRPDPGVRAGWWMRRGRHILPSAKTGRMLDLNDINGARLLRANLEHSRLSQADIERWVSAYGRASSPASRFAIYNASENAALRTHMERYGLNAAQMDQLLPLVNKWRTGARQVLGSARRFMSADVRKLAEKRIAQGRKAEADALTKLAGEIDAAVKRGDMPAAGYHLPDEDGNLAIIPEDADIATTAPVMASQQADVVPLVDWNVLENALWWNTKGGFGRNVYKGVDGIRAAADSLMTVWKIAAILRPGYIWRALSDEVGRMWGVMGSARAFMAAVPAAQNAPYNMASRGILLGEVITRRTTRRRASGRTDIELDGELVDEAPALPKGSLAEDAWFDPYSATTEGQVYHSYERALADGLIGVDDFVERMESHGATGSLPRRLAEVYHGKVTAESYKGAEAMYRRHAVDAALSSVGRGTYIEPAWQQSVINTLVQQRLSKKRGEVGTGMLVDPFSGQSPRVKWSEVGDKFTFSNTRVVAAEAGGVFDHEAVYNFVADHVDELLKPSVELAAYITPAGDLSLSVATRDATAAADLAIKPGGGRRVKIPFSKAEGRLYRDSGSASFRVAVGGQSVTIRGAFEGQSGDLFRSQTSSRGVDEAWADTMSNVEFARLAAKSGRWVDVSPEMTDYGDAWQRAVNLQLANDPVARQLIAGKSVDDVMAWMHNTSAGRAYNAKMGPWRSRYAEQVQVVQSMVDLYLPRVDGMEEASEALRKKALAGEAKISDFEAIVSKEDMPRVHGASLESALLKGQWTDWFRRRVDDAFKVLSDIPSDKFVRHPFANDRYRLHVDELLKARSGHLDKRTFTQDDLDAVEKEARSRALSDVRKYLYENASSLDLAKAFRLLVPFGSAIGDSTVKWGVVLREKPWVAFHVWKLWNAPDRAGLVQDENGNQLRIEDGKEVWYKIDPKTGEATRLDGHVPKSKRIVLRLPSWLGPQYAKGMQPLMRMDKSVFHTFLDMPTFGPLVTVPSNEFALSNPEFAENRFVRSFILPYGPSADWKKSGVPGNVRTFWEQWQGEDAPEAEGQAQSIYVTEMVNYAQGKRSEPPTYEEARSKAADMRGLRFWYRLSGVSSQFVSPYQPYIDHYHLLQQQASTERAKAERGEPADTFDPDERFYAEMGSEFFALTASMTRNAMGLPATIGAYNQHRKLRNLMEQFPELAPMIAGAEGAGEFSRAVYESQKQTETRFGSGQMMREKMTPEDSWADVERRRGWIEYGQFMDSVHSDMYAMGVTSLEQKAAARLKAARERWINARKFVDSPYGGTVVSPWYQEFASFDTSRMTARLHNMRQIVQDHRLQGRDDIRGLVDYLTLRSQFKNVMTASKFKTLSAQKAANLRLQWQSSVFALKQSNLSFAQLYDRWLSNDESLEAD